MLFWMTILCSLIFISPAAAQELTFQQAAGLMLEQNPALAQRIYETRIALKQSQQTQTAYLPQVDFTQGWTRSNNPVYVFGTLLNQQQFGPENFAVDSLNHPEPISDYSSRFELGWLLFDFGRRESGISAAKTGYRIAQLQEEAFRASLLQELVRRYYAVSLSQQQIEVAEDALRSAQSRLEQAQERVKQGMVVQSDLLSAQVFVASRTQEKIDAVNSNRLAVVVLQELLGKFETLPLVTSPLKEKDFPEHELSWWQDEMKGNRPEFKIAAEAHRLAKARLGTERSDLFPSLQAWSAYEWHGTSLSYTGENWGAGLQLRWNLFRGFTDALQISAAKLQERSAAEKQRETENALLLQVQSGYYRYQSAREKLKVAAAALEQAAENRRIYAERYAAGLVTIQDSLQAETAYRETRLMHSRNLYETHVAYAELLAASGKSEEIPDM